MNPTLTVLRPGCFDCLLNMPPGCKWPVRRVGEGNLHFGEEALSATSATFAWTGNVGYGKHTVVEWMVQRQLLLDEFLSKLATWEVKYRRATRCRYTVAEMEITEHGLSDGDSRSDFN
jgi:hypothetical protein